MKRILILTILFSSQFALCAPKCLILPVIEGVEEIFESKLEASTQLSFGCPSSQLVQDSHVARLVRLTTYKEKKMCVYRIPYGRIFMCESQ